MIIYFFQKMSVPVGKISNNHSANQEGEIEHPPDLIKEEKDAQIAAQEIDGRCLPFIDADVERIVQRSYGLEVLSVQELDSYMDKNFHVRVGKATSNTNIQELHPHGYVVKIYQDEPSQKQKLLDAQHSVMSVLTRNSISTPQPMPTRYGTPYLVETGHWKQEGRDCSGQYLVEMVTYVEGHNLRDGPITPRLLYEDGQTVGHVSLALQGFNHPDLIKPRDLVWSLTNVPLMASYTSSLDHQRDRDIIGEVISAYSKEVLPKLNKLPIDCLHGDLNSDNVLVKPCDRVNHRLSTLETCPENHPKHCHISGVIDFGHVMINHRIFELAVNIAYTMRDSLGDVDQLDAPGHILAGYLSVMSLTETEWDVLYLCIAGRLAQSATYGAYYQNRDPTNVYINGCGESTLSMLRRLWALPRDDIMARWQTILQSYAE